MPNITTHQRAYGQFFTPEPVVACCYALLAGLLPHAPWVADPACGDGAFLRYAATHAISDRDHIAGCDVDAALAGGLAADLPLIRHADGLDPASLPAASFDLVIGNPPFGIGTADNGGAPLASEVRFLLRALELARPGGHVALVLPSGVLANERLRALRAELLVRCTALAVIALPRETFRQAGTHAACSILLLHTIPAPTDHRVFFALPTRLDDLPRVVAAYHGRLQIADCRLQISEHQSQSTIPKMYWLPQTPALARRMDAHFWRPDHHALLERLATRNPLLPLGELIDRRQALIPGDHVRPSRGESKGPGLPYEYYQTREFMAAGYNYAAIERCDERAYQRLRRTAVRRHDILVSCAGVGGAGRGRVCLITHEPGPSCTGDVFILRVQRPDPLFLHMFLSTSAGRAQLLRLQNGVSTANLSADELLQVEVPLLPCASQRALAARYAPIAEAHAAAMAALIRGDRPGFERDRSRAEGLLEQLKREVEEMLVGAE
jgi:hypothetical protein